MLILGQGNVCLRFSGSCTSSEYMDNKQGYKGKTRTSRGLGGVQRTIEMQATPLFGI